MINQLTISDWRLAMDSRLSIRDFAAWIPIRQQAESEGDRGRSFAKAQDDRGEGRDDSAGESLIANALRMDNCKSLIGNSVGVALC